MDFREAVVTCLENNVGVDMSENICCYPSGDGSFVVEFMVDDSVKEVYGLTKHQQEMLEEEGEFAEFFDTTTEAADFFLMLREENKKVVERQANHFRKSLAERLKEGTVRPVLKLVADELVADEDE